MSLPRLTHPGPVTGARLEAVPCLAHPLTLHLRAGRPLAQAVAEAMAEVGFAGGYLRLEGLELSPLVWVIPAPAPGDGRVAWFSEPYSLSNGRVLSGGLHLGRRGEAALCHCHGVWTAGEGAPRMGHLRCDDSILAKDALVRGWGLSGAIFRQENDAETGFTLFAPVATGGSGPGQKAFLCRLRPNEDVAALTSLGLGPARIEGIGSLIGAHFEAGPSVEGTAAEFLVERGAMDDAGTRLEVVVTGMDGTMRSGVLAPGRNAICVTAELLLIPAR